MRRDPKCPIKLPALMRWVVDSYREFRLYLRGGGGGGGGIHSPLCHSPPPPPPYISEPHVALLGFCLPCSFSTLPPPPPLAKFLYTAPRAYRLYTRRGHVTSRNGEILIVTISRPMFLLLPH